MIKIPIKNVNKEQLIIETTEEDVSIVFCQY
jgi:hypothetical protein